MKASDIEVWSVIAEWVGAVGTAGALLLGVGLFYIDRRDRRRSQADQFNVTLSGRYVATVTVSENGHVVDGGESTLVLTASNDSDSNIYRPVAYIPRPDGKPGFGKLPLFDVENETGIRKQTTITAKRRVPNVGVIRSKAIVRFTDAKNRNWWRYIESGKYLWGPPLWRVKAVRQFMSLAAEIHKS